MNIYVVTQGIWVIGAGVSEEAAEGIIKTDMNSENSWVERNKNRTDMILPSKLWRHNYSITEVQLEN